MDKPQLPPKPSDWRPPISASNVELPERIQLLRSEEVNELLAKHKDQLQKYVLRFNDCSTVKSAVLEEKKRLENLLNNFELLESRKKTLFDNLDHYKSLEAQYLSQWQELDHLMTTTFSDGALKRQVQSDLRDLDERSLSIEKNGHHDIDEMIKMYMSVRTTYHLQREKLETWNTFGSLQKDQIKVYTCYAI